MHLATVPSGMRWVSWSRYPDSGGSYAMRPASEGAIATTARRARTRTPPSACTITLSGPCSISRTAASRTTVSAPSRSATRCAMSCEPPTKRSCCAPPSVSNSSSMLPAEPEDFSLLHMLFYIHSAGSIELLFDTEGGAQQDRFVGGSQLIAQRVAERLGAETVVRDAAVRLIEHGPDSVIVHADGGVRVRARRAVVAIAPSLAGRIAYDPPLSGYRDQLTQRMPLGTVAKCMALYDEPFWREQGLSGQATSDTGPVKLTYDNSPPDGSPGVLLG